MRTACFILILIAAVRGEAQPAKRNRPADFVFNIQAGIPRPVSSKMFRTSFGGVYEAMITAHARVFENVRVGLGYGITGFENDKDIFIFYQVPSSKANLSFNTKLVT